MKKILIVVLMFAICSTTALALDKTSKNYLCSKKHFAPMNPVVESIVGKEIKKALKKETNADFKVKFSGYTISSMKKGIFKDLEIVGKDITVEGIYLPYVKVKTLSDYNWIDYTKNPVVMKSDMIFKYDLELSEKSINDALKNKDYQKTIQNVNKKAYPLFVLHDVRVRIKNNKVYTIIDYNFPINPSSKNKMFYITSEFGVENGVIKATNISLDKAYSNLSLTKVANLMNLINPLSFTLELVKSKKSEGKIDNIKIVDNKFQINGRIFVKGE